jgi:hypothetical protein
MGGLPPEPAAEAPPHLHRCHALRRLPVDQLTSGDLRMLITQGIGLEHLMPIAMSRLRQEPLLQGEYYPGDLLCAAITVQPGDWSGSSGDWTALRAIAREAQGLIATQPEPNHFRQVSKSIAHFLAEDAA